MIINADGLILGRMASFVAKKLLEGEEVIIVNCEKAVVTGKKEYIFSLYKQRIDRHTLGNPEKGPKFPKTPEGIVKRAIRGMVPFKKKRGREAMRRLKIYVGVPENVKDFDDVNVESIEGKTSRFVKVKEISESLGYRVIS